MDGKLFIISAPSGAGKTSLVNALIERIRIYRPIDRVITYTTKDAHTCEQEGCDYYFIKQEEFKKKIKEGFFVEWSCEYGHYYGSPRFIIDEVERGRCSILIIDRVGAEKIASLYSKAVLIWIYTSSKEQLRERLILRKRETEQEIQHRLTCAEREIAREISCPLYHYHILNDIFDEALDKLCKVIQSELS